MSVASSLPKIRILSPSTPSSSSSSPSPSPSSMSMFRSSALKPSLTIIRSSQTEGPLRRPVAPPLKPVTPPRSPPPPSPPVSVSGASPEVDRRVITLEFQRQKAKELQQYFKQKKLEVADQGPVFGFFGRNEIANGRWAMFGFAVGLLTEYATGSDFVDQVKILLSNFGILDLE